MHLRAETHASSTSSCLQPRPSVIRETRAKCTGCGDVRIVLCYSGAPPYHAAAGAADDDDADEDQDEDEDDGGGDDAAALR